jgi:hypothetical protein
LEVLLLVNVCRRLAQPTNAKAALLAVGRNDGYGHAGDAMSRLDEASQFALLTASGEVL